jgi:WbqC-like protein family
MPYSVFMAPRTATVFSLALFPPVFLFERVLNADVVFVLSDRRLDDKNHANQCVLRSAAGVPRRVEIPVHRKGVPIDEVDVPEPSTWFPEMQQQVRQTYSGLPMASAATELVSQLLPPYASPWLTDYLLHPFVMTLRWLGWEKEIVRGATVQRRYYLGDADSEYLLDLCLQNKCNRFIVGTGPEINYRPLFRTKGVSIISQRWQGSANLPARDSILDAVARLSGADICGRMR